MCLVYKPVPWYTLVIVGWSHQCKATCFLRSGVPPPLFIIVCMRVITPNNSYPEKYSVEVLQIIDLQSQDMSCVYTTLVFIIDQHKKFALPGKPVVTFDLPLWVRAMTVKEHKLLEVTILMGNFHTQLSYLGVIGYIMANSCLKEVLSLIYNNVAEKKL